MISKTSSEHSSPEVDTAVSSKYEHHGISQPLLQGNMWKSSLPTKSQSFLGSLNQSWASLKIDTRKQYLMSELLTKVHLRQKLSLFPAHCNPKLVLSNKSRECHQARATCPGLRGRNHERSQSSSLRSAPSGGGGGGYSPCPQGDRRPHRDGGDIAHVLRESLVLLEIQKQKKKKIHTYRMFLKSVHLV